MMLDVHTDDSAPDHVANDLGPVGRWDAARVKRSAHMAPMSGAVRGRCRLTGPAGSLASRYKTTDTNNLGSD